MFQALRTGLTGETVGVDNLHSGTGMQISHRQQLLRLPPATLSEHHNFSRGAKRCSNVSLVAGITVTCHTNHKQ